MSTPTHVPWATLCQSRRYPPVSDLGFGLRCFDGFCARLLLQALRAFCVHKWNLQSTYIQGADDKLGQTLWTHSKQQK